MFLKGKKTQKNLHSLPEIKYFFPTQDCNSNWPQQKPHQFIKEQDLIGKECLNFSAQHKA